MRKISIEFVTEADEPTLQDIALLEITAWGGRPDLEQVDTRKQRLARELGQLDPDTKNILMVRESDAVLGVCRVEQTRENPQEWMLFGLAVHPDRRRRGLGRALVQASIRFVRSHGASSIRSETHADNRTSIAFHKDLGFLDEGGFIALDGDEKVAFSMAIADPQGT